MFSQVPEDLQSILLDPTLHNASSDITTKEILKRYGDIGINGPRHQVETEQSPMGRSRDGSGRALAPVVTRVDTDPSQAHAWQKESSVRHVQEPSVPYAAYQSNQNTPPPQQWQGQDFEQSTSYPLQNGTPDSQREEPRREYRNSGWRAQNGSVGVTGAG
jgi:hypothetical protein